MNKKQTTWHSGPPPFVGWWQASAMDNQAWRWWNGETWSLGVSPECSPYEISIPALTNQSKIQWSEYWPEGARVPRVDPALPRNVYLIKGINRGDLFLSKDITFWMTPCRAEDCSFHEIYKRTNDNSIRPRAGDKDYSGREQRASLDEDDEQFSDETTERLTNIIKSLSAQHLLHLQLSIIEEFASRLDLS